MHRLPMSPSKAWSAIVAEVIRVRPTLGHLLSEGVVVAEEGGRLTVAVPNGSAFAADQLKKVENRELVLETARRLQTGLRDIAFTSSGAAGAGAAGTQLTIRVWAEGDETAAPDVEWELTCDPAGGSHPDADGACAAIAANALIIGPAPDAFTCTQQYGGPAIATVEV